MFKCKYGACIKKSEKCNGIPNCADGSDEIAGCPGSTTDRTRPTIINTTNPTPSSSTKVTSRRQ